MLEVNQACAVNSGCFSGDTAGWPVSIDGSAGRSYRLTADLTVPVTMHGIVISASSVSIDLNGFEVIGEACAGATTLACRPNAPGSGIRVAG